MKLKIWYEIDSPREELHLIDQVECDYYGINESRSLYLVKRKGNNKPSVVIRQYNFDKVVKIEAED